MKRFKGFTNDQTHQLLKELGYTGPAQKDDMDAFLASSPRAASQLGRYTDIAKQRIEGGPLSGVGMFTGGPASRRLAAAARAKEDAEAAKIQEIDAETQDFEDPETKQIIAGDEGVIGDVSDTGATSPFAGINLGDGVDPDPVDPVDPDPTDPPEGLQILKPGTPTPETTQASTDLDAAQKAYSDAMGQLTEAQKALSGAETPEGNSTVDPETGKLPNAPYDGLKEELGDTFGSQLSSVGGINYFNEPDFKGIVDSGEIPDNPENYEITGSDQNWTITYPNGKTIKVTGNLGAAEIVANASVEVFNNIKESKLVADTDAYNQLITNVSDAELLTTQTQADVSTKQKQFETTDIPSTSEALGKAITTPSSVLQQPTVYGLKVENNQLIDEGTGQVATAASLLVKQAQAADAVDDPAVKATMAYLNKFTDEELREKYPLPPLQYELFEQDVASLSDADKATRNDFITKLKRRQAQIAQDAKKDAAETYKAVMSQDKVKTALETFAAATGTPSEDALMKAETMLPEDLAQLDLDAETLDIIRQIPEMKMSIDRNEFPTAALFDEYTESEEQEFEGDVKDVDPAKFETETPRAKPEVDYNLPPTQVAEQKENKIKDAAQFDEYATAPEKKSEFEPDVTAEETIVGADEIVDVNKILNSEEVVVAAKTLEALNGDAVAEAQSASFTQQLEAKAVKGTVSAASTVQGQLANLMDQFNDGTPAWAAGALRRVTAAMNARGMGGSSMASAAMIQAAMESAIPIAQSDAATFQAMDMENVRNEQAVALANAAAAQNFELANLSNRQATNLQNSMNNSNLQLKNLSNEQEAVLAMAQFKASLQGQELSISSNVAIANAARYAAVNDINLTNRQQTSILRSTQNLEVEMANLSNEQQTALSNLQVKAAMMGQNLTNEQQMAVLESTQAFEANMADATRKQQAFIQDAVASAAMEGRVLDNKQQTALFNVANAVAEREIELNNEQQTAIFNMSNKLTIGLEELSGRQQTALANAQIEAAMKGQELSNKQQVAVIKAERIAEIANINFTAEQSRALQNAQLAQTVDLANLSNKQAKLMADVAAFADVDMANLNNRQQAAAQQAQAFLQMDMANLDNEQQAVMFEAQSLVQSVFSDQAAENAQLQFNAESINQVNQFFDSLSTQVNQFNVAQSNAMEQFNAGEENSMTKFQAELDNQRDLFNAQNELVIAQANTAWRQSIATANTAALNEANMTEVMAANNLSMQGLAELWQQERDLMNFAWTTAENAMTRDQELVVAKLKVDGDADTGFMSAAGGFLGSVLNAFGPSIGKSVFGSNFVAPQ
jgi:hypothetical protein